MRAVPGPVPPGWRPGWRGKMGAGWPQQLPRSPGELRAGPRLRPAGPGAGPGGSDTIHQARTYGLLGLVHSRLGEHRQAISAYQQALAIARAWKAPLPAKCSQACWPASVTPARPPMTRAPPARPGSRPCKSATTWDCQTTPGSAPSSTRLASPASRADRQAHTLAAHANGPSSTRSRLRQGRHNPSSRHHTLGSRAKHHARLMPPGATHQALARAGHPNLLSGFACCSGSCRGAG